MSDIVTRKVFEHIPKLSIVTALTYIVIVFFNKVYYGVFSSLTPIATEVMLFGAYLAVPAILIDVALSESFEPQEALVVGFTNFFALLLEYTSSNWIEAQIAATYAMYFYIGLVIVGLIVYIVGSYRKAAAKQKR